MRSAVTAGILIANLLFIWWFRRYSEDRGMIAANPFKFIYTFYCVTLFGGLYAARLSDVSIASRFTKAFMELQVMLLLYSLAVPFVIGVKSILHKIATVILVYSASLLVIRILVR